MKNRDQTQVVPWRVKQIQYLKEMYENDLTIITIKTM